MTKETRDTRHADQVCGWRTRLASWGGFVRSQPVERSDSFVSLRLAAYRTVTEGRLLLLYSYSLHHNNVHIDIGRIPTMEHRYVGSSACRLFERRLGCHDCYGAACRTHARHSKVCNMRGLLLCKVRSAEDSETLIVHGRLPGPNTGVLCAVP
jgi:hypothetical protein